MRKRFLGDTKHFCPVALHELNVLWPGDPDKAAVYRNKIYFFSKDEARDKFIKNPRNYTAGAFGYCNSKLHALKLPVLPLDCPHMALLLDIRFHAIANRFLPLCSYSMRLRTTEVLKHIFKILSVVQQMKSPYPAHRYESCYLVQKVRDFLPIVWIQCRLRTSRPKARCIQRYSCPALTFL